MLIILCCAALVALFVQYSNALTGCLHKDVQISTFSLHAGFGKKASNSDLTSTPISPSSESMCKCRSGEFYGECCQPFHNGSLIPSNPVKLVRSRYSAYAYGFVPYIMATTHPSHKEYAAEEQKSKMSLWRRNLNTYVRDYEFLDLKFIDETRDSQVPPPTAESVTVAFQARLQRKTMDYPVQIISELSTFMKDKKSDRWLYAGKLTILIFFDITIISYVYLLY